jgi:hypothetical protein
VNQTPIAHRDPFLTAFTPCRFSDPEENAIIRPHFGWTTLLKTVVHFILQKRGPDRVYLDLCSVRIRREDKFAAFKIIIQVDNCAVISPSVGRR